jgi:hypothetical protein
MGGALSGFLLTFLLTGNRVFDGLKIIAARGPEGPAGWGYKQNKKSKERR